MLEYEAVFTQTFLYSFHEIVLDFRQHVGGNIVDSLDDLHLEIVNARGFNQINQIRQIAPNEKIQWIEIRRSRWPLQNWSIATSHPSEKIVCQKISHTFRDMRWCTIVHINNFVWILAETIELRYDVFIQHIQVALWIHSSSLENVWANDVCVNDSNPDHEIFATDPLSRVYPFGIYFRPVPIRKIVAYHRSNQWQKSPGKFIYRWFCRLNDAVIVNCFSSDQRIFFMICGCPVHHLSITRQNSTRLARSCGNNSWWICFLYGKNPSIFRRIFWMTYPEQRKCRASCLMDRSGWFSTWSRTFSTNSVEFDSA